MSAGGEKAGERTLEDWAERFGVALSAEERDGLLAYGRLLLAWGERINLTAAKSLDALVAGHFSDSFAIAARLRKRGGPGMRIVDVGSGGGLPGIPLALLRPQDAVTLIEATGKKVAFLRTAIRELDLGGRVLAVHRRVDLAGDEAEGSFDVATSRAMLAPTEWLVLARRLVRVGGVVFCLATARVGATDGLTLVDEAAYRPDRWVAELERST